jgi:hypothetical protein
MRPETGPMEFEDDWRGIFIRGDNALMGYLPMLQRIRANLREENENVLDLITLKSLIDLLSFANHTDDTDDTDVQMMKKFEDCKK